MAEIIEADRQSNGNRRKFTIGACWFQFFISGIFYGLSPLALPVTNALTDHDDEVSWEGGVFFYGFGILMACQSLTCCVAAFYIEFQPLKRKQQFIMCAYMAWPIGFLFLALSVQFKSWPLLLFGVFPLLGFTIGVQVGYVHLVLMATMWGDNLHRGHGLSGGASGTGAFVWTLVFGEVIHSLGPDRIVESMWIFCALHTAGVLLGLVFFNPSLHLKEPAEDEQADVAKTASMRELARNWRVYLFVFVVESFFFAGLAMKTLMSELFEELLGLEYIHAVRYSVGCLAAYAVTRFVAPFFASGDHVFVIFASVLAFEGLAYALTPWAVGLERGTLAIYTGFRIAGGIGFAVLKSTTGVFLVRIFGSENVARVSGIFLGTEILVGLGPTLAFTLHVEEVRAGKNAADSYDVFFYFCAALVMAASFGTLVLWKYNNAPPAPSVGKADRKGATHKPEDAQLPEDVSI